MSHYKHQHVFAQLTWRRSDEMIINHSYQKQIITQMIQHRLSLLKKALFNITSNIPHEIQFVLDDQNDFNEREEMRFKLAANLFKETHSQNTQPHFFRNRSPANNLLPIKLPTESNKNWLMKVFHKASTSAISNTLKKLKWIDQHNELTSLSPIAPISTTPQLANETRVTTDFP